MFCWLELILAQHRFSCSVVGPCRSGSAQRTSAPWLWDAGPQTSAWLLMCWRVGGQGQATGTLKDIRGRWGSSAAPATFCRLFCPIRNKFAGAWGRADLNEIRADTAVAAVPRFMLVWVFVAVYHSLTLLCLRRESGQTGGRCVTESRGVQADGDGTSLLHCVCWKMPVTNHLKHTSELLELPILRGCERKPGGETGLQKHDPSPAT